nr:sulfite exporter TauE/SafE family protein [Aquisalinus luteolus]
MTDLLPYSGLILAMLLSGLLAGLVAGMFGIGGGFVVVPALAAVLSIFTAGTGADDRIMHVAIGTSLATIIVTSIRSVHAHARRGAVDFDILKTWAPYIIGGVVIGILLAKFMDGRTLKLIFGFGVLLMGLHFIFPFLARRGALADSMPTGPLRTGLGSFIGGFCALLGIGGGTPAVLLMTLSGIPIHRAVATAAGFGTLIAIPGAIGAILVGWGEEGLPPFSLGYVNLIGLVAITTMSVITAPIGVALAHNLDAARLKRVFGIYLVLTSTVMLYFAMPKLVPAVSGDEPLQAGKPATLVTASDTMERKTER